MDLRASTTSTSQLFQDENICSSSSSFSNMTQAFSQRIAELQQLVCFRVEDSVKHIFVRDIQGIEASVRALEQLFEELRQRTQQEMAVVPKAKALLQAAKLQQQHLLQISANLPQHLPSSSLPPLGQAVAGSSGAGAAATGVAGVKVPGAPATAAGGADQAGHQGKAAPGDRRRGNAAGAAAAASAGAVAGGSSSSSVPAAAVPPRWYVTAGELASLPSYMRGRLTLEKVNAAVDELAGHAAACHKAMALVGRNQLMRVASEERQRLLELYHAVEVKEAARGRFWFVETDLRNGNAVRMDKTGKSILMMLRHLGRLAEVRAVLESGSVLAYVLQAP